MTHQRRENSRIQTNPTTGLMMVTSTPRSEQERRFDRRLRDLVNLRAVERGIVRRLELLAEAGCTAATWDAAERSHADCVGALKMAAMELAVTYYTD